MRRRLAAASVLGMATLGLAGITAPAFAADGVAAVPLADGQQAADFHTAKINMDPPASTYALVTFKSVAGGINIRKVVFTGVMAGNGCVTAVLYKNGEATRNTPQKCFSKGTRVTATWTGFGFRPDGTHFEVDFLGAGGPRGVERFSVIKK